MGSPLNVVIFPKLNYLKHIEIWGNFDNDRLVKIGNSPFRSGATGLGITMLTMYYGTVFCESIFVCVP